MAKRRRVGNMLALAVLSALVQRPMHPYEMATALRDWGKDQDMPIKWGSLYTVVQNMTKHGLIEPVENVREGRRPERTVYKITQDGRDELLDWARELISVPEREHPRFRAGLSVLAALPPDEAASLLQQRLSSLEAHLVNMRDELQQHGKTIPRLFLIEGEYDLAIQTAEVGWVRGLLAELVEGTFPLQAQWRAYHERGEMPAEIAALAERGLQ